MAKLISLPQFIDERGELTVVENLLPEDYKRVYFIKNADGHIRGNHSHKKSHQALICINGSVDVKVRIKEQIMNFTLNSSNQCLLLKPDEWHFLENFRNDAILLVASTENYNLEDYIW
jgi:dTDP-4-dehydrorhamnose 3,5-epimerase-like enzyme